MSSKYKTINIKLLNINTIEKLDALLEKEKEISKQELYETLLLIGIENYNKPPIMDNTKYLQKIMDVKFTNIIKYLIVNEKKINLIINSLSENKIIDQKIFMDDKSTLQLTDDCPWVLKLKEDLDNDY